VYGVRGDRDNGPEGQLTRCRLTERDVSLARWAGHWRAVLASQVQARFGIGSVVCYRRLAALVDMGLLRYRRVFHGEPGVYLSTSGGLAVAGVEMAAPRIDLATYRHDLVAVWAALAVESEIAASGLDGARVVGERELRSIARSAGAPARQSRLSGLGAGSGRANYPDVAVVDANGRVLVAMEVELSSKGRRRVERVLAGYVRDRHLRRVVYLTDRPGVAASVQRAARGTGADELVVVRNCRIAGQGARLCIDGGPLLSGLGRRS
jgi:hypothetical protein